MTPIKSVTAETSIPIPGVTATLLHIVLFCYPRITLHAMPDGTIRLDDPIKRKGLPEYIKARETVLWKQITKG